VGLFSTANKDQMMVDYSEGYLEMKRQVDLVWKLLLENRFAEARAACDMVVVEARMTKAKIGAQHDDQQGG
jgi:soluble cytochrome b562